MTEEKKDDYMDNYRLLEEAANTLSNQDTPDVDKIIPMVQQGAKAYKKCMARIKEVEKLLADVSNDDEDK